MRFKLIANSQALSNPPADTSVILGADSKSHLVAYNSKSIHPRSKIIIPVERRELVYVIFKFKFLNFYKMR